MKKIISLVFAILLFANITIIASASENYNSKKQVDVKATYQENARVTVYSVDISWSELTFTYNAGSEGEWNPDTHTYENATEARWNESKGVIIVNNRSNADIVAIPSYSAAKGYESVNMDFSTNTLKIPTADNGVDGGAGKVVSGEIIVTPNGTLPKGTNGAKIGTITIAIN